VGKITQSNPFLGKLLNLQQDGSEAISAPTNWTKSMPLLEVETELNEVIDQLAQTCLYSGSTDEGSWHFFIGSPGNGKSAAVGQLVRKLILEENCSIFDDRGTPLEKLHDDEVPYWLDVYEKEMDKPSLRIVQDASVVKDPYSNEVDPAEDLLSTLEGAWEEGISLVICTNRGVLEKAFRDSCLDKNINQKTWHKGILRQIADNNSTDEGEIRALETENTRALFKNIITTSTYLDNRSLILSDRGILTKLISKATQEKNWSSCTQCEVVDRCPFKANRDWLCDDTGLSTVIHLFKLAEVYSGQVIVFREALATISFILAGCSKDYSEGDPCKWVNNLSLRGDIFGLASRRIFMSLFCSHHPRGLEHDVTLLQKQIQTITYLTQLPNGLDGELNNALRTILENPVPSSDVGISRLLSKHGVLKKLDPTHGPQPQSFYDRWDGNFEYMLNSDSKLISSLDKQCIKLWHDLEIFIENIATHHSSELYWSIRRWSSQYTLHLGALLEGTVLNSKHIDEFTEMLELLWKNADDRNIDEHQRLSDLEGLVQKLLNRASTTEDTDSNIILTDNVTVEGQWIDQHMSPSIEPSPASGSLSIAVRFGDAKDYTTLAAVMYLWLRQRATGNMDQRCIPEDLLNEAMDARSRAAIKSEYAFIDDHVSLKVKDDKRKYTLTRFHGEVAVNVES
jgi:hypothetical protein